jgi:hypothetical protein
MNNNSRHARFFGLVTLATGALAAVDLPSAPPLERIQDSTAVGLAVATAYTIVQRIARRATKVDDRYTELMTKSIRNNMLGGVFPQREFQVWSRAERLSMMTTLVACVLVYNVGIDAAKYEMLKHAKAPAQHSQSELPNTPKPLAWSKIPNKKL